MILFYFYFIFLFNQAATKTTKKRKANPQPKKKDQKENPEVSSLAYFAFLMSSAKNSKPFVFYFSNLESITIN